MSISRQITVWCDGCGEWFQVTALRVGAAERIAKDEDWTIKILKHAGKQHFCRACSSKIKEEK